MGALCALYMPEAGDIITEIEVVAVFNAEMYRELAKHLLARFFPGCHLESFNYIPV